VRSGRGRRQPSLEEMRRAEVYGQWEVASKSISAVIYRAREDALLALGREQFPVLRKRSNELLLRIFGMQGDVRREFHCNVMTEYKSFVHFTDYNCACCFLPHSEGYD